MNSLVALAAAKKYTQQTVAGAGAIKGSPCTIKNVEYDSEGNTVITFEWTGTDGSKYEQIVTVNKGDEGDQGAEGDPGFSPEISVMPITGGHQVAITSAEGTQYFNVMDGASSGIDDASVSTTGLWSSSKVSSMLSTKQDTDSAIIARDFANDARWQIGGQFKTLSDYRCADISSWVQYISALAQKLTEGTFLFPWNLSTLVEIYGISQNGQELYFYDYRNISIGKLQLTQLGPNNEQVIYIYGINLMHVVDQAKDTWVTSGQLAPVAFSGSYWDLSNAPKVDSQFNTSSTNPVENRLLANIIPTEANSSNPLADRNFVNSSIQTQTANFRGSWATWEDVPENADDYPEDYAGNTTPTVNDYMVVLADEWHDNATWRYKYTRTWDIAGKRGWDAEYQINSTTFTADQLAALNSGITQEGVTKLGGLSNYTLPSASSYSLGGIKVGANLSISSDGTLSATGGGTTYEDATQAVHGLMSTSDKTKLDGIAANANNYILPTASTTTLGGVKVDGSTITINDGVITSVGGSGGTIQKTSLPTATAALVGTIYQFVGTTTASYTNGLFYKCMQTKAPQLTAAAWTKDSATAVGPGTGYTKSATPAVGDAVYSDSACTTKELTVTSIVSSTKFQSNSLAYYDRNTAKDVCSAPTYGWVNVVVDNLSGYYTKTQVDAKINDTTPSASTTYSSNKIDGLFDNVDSTKLNANLVWTGTQAECKAQIDSIPEGAVVNITDDESFVTNIDDMYEILQTRASVVANTKTNAIVGALAGKEISEAIRKGSIETSNVAADLNAVSYIISQYNSSTLNSPYKAGKTSSAQGLVLTAGDTSWSCQLVLPLASATLYVRSCANGTWSGWFKISSTSA